MVTAGRFRRTPACRLRGLGEVAGDAVDGGSVFLDEAAEVLGGLVLFVEGDGVVAVEDVAVVGGEQNFGGDGDEIAGGLAAGGVVGERRDGLREDGAVSVASASGEPELRMRYLVRVLSSRMVAWVKAISVWKAWALVVKIGTARVRTLPGMCVAEPTVW